MQLHHRNKVLITGASRGIGLSIAEALARKADFEFYLVARNQSDLQIAADKINIINPRSTVSLLSLDLCNDAQLIQLMEKVPQVDILINNAGVGVFGRFSVIDFQRISHMMKLNCEVPLQLIHYYLPQMKKGSGTIINISSLAGVFPIPYFSAYSATKAFLNQFGQALNYELKDQDIKLITVCPAGVKTQFHVEAGLPEDLIQRFEKSIMTSDQIAQMTVHALQGSSSWVVPGVGNQFAVFLSRFLPRNIMTQILGSIYRRYEKP